MPFALLFIAMAIVLVLVLWTGIYVSAFRLLLRAGRERKDPQELELEKLASELDDAKSKLLGRAKTDEGR